MKCVVRRTTLSLAFSCNKDHISRLEYGSIPLVGSSNITTFFIKQQQKNIMWSDTTILETFICQMAFKQFLFQDCCPSQHWGLWYYVMVRFHTILILISYNTSAHCIIHKKSYNKDVVTKTRNDLQWSTMTYNDLQWSTMTYNDLQWATMSC